LNEHLSEPGVSLLFYRLRMIFRGGLSVPVLKVMVSAWSIGYPQR
jgi:hypothetical protein